MTSVNTVNCMYVYTIWKMVYLAPFISIRLALHNRVPFQNFLFNLKHNMAIDINNKNNYYMLNGLKYSLPSRVTIYDANILKLHSAISQGYVGPKKLLRKISSELYTMVTASWHVQ